MGDSESLSPLLVYEFKADGVLIMSIKNVPVQGPYQIIDTDTFRMMLPILGAERTTEMDFVRSGDTLTFSSEGYSQTFYKTP